MEIFQSAADSIIGCDHTGRGNVLVGKNNQDAFRVREDGDRIVAIVCDGCGSQPFSEFGAQFGANTISKAIIELMPQNGATNTENDLIPLLENVRSKVLNEIIHFVRILDSDRIQALNHFFLFTVIGIIVDRDGCSIFSIGDGYYFLNGQCHPLGPFPDNEPPYMAYGITGTKSKSRDSDAWKFKIESHIPLEEFSHAMIGSDGIKHLIAAAEKNMPGKSETVGGIEQFWMNDEYFDNPAALHKKLALTNRNFAANRNGELKREPGLLPDDTTLAVIRRKPIEEGESNVYLP